VALVLLIFGPPGAGKGTQATAVAQRAGVPHIATGDMFRAQIKAGTPLGVEAKGYSSRGELVPDGVTIQMLGERISEPDTAPGFLLDGFPRTLPQAEALDRLLAERGRSVTALLNLEVPDDEIVRRITGRLVGQHSGRIYHETDAPPKVAGVDDADGTPLVRRPDDAEDVVRERLRVFHDETVPVLERARSEGVRVVQVDGARPPEVVAAELGEIVDGLPR
jgi:adenylate kinase